MAKTSVANNLLRALYSAIEEHITKPINSKMFGKRDDMFVDSLLELLEKVGKISEGLKKLQNLVEGKSLNDKIEIEKPLSPASAESKAIQDALERKRGAS